MYRDLTFAFSLLSLMAAAAFVPATLAQESLNATLNNTTMDNITLNNTALNDTAGTALSDTALNNTVLNQAAPDQMAINETVLNLSTTNNETMDAAPISDMAKVAPEVAAKAPAVQVATDPEGVYKLGEGIGGRDLFEMKEKDIKTMEIGLPIKPLRDVGKMVFVCDIV
jgi:hypothetical protein